jgi:hypothetical protein
VHRRAGLRQQRLEPRAALLEGQRAQILAVRGEQVERHEGRRGFLCELRRARRGGVQAQLQEIEIEALRRCDDDLAVDDAAVGERRDQAVVQLGKVTIERPKVPALDIDGAAAAKDDRAKAVPLGLEEEGA